MSWRGPGATYPDGNTKRRADTVRQLGEREEKCPKRARKSEDEQRRSRRWMGRRSRRRSERRGRLRW